MAKERVSITVHLIVGEDDDLIRRFSKVTGADRAKMAKTLWRNKPVTIGGQTGDTALLEDLVNRVYWLQEEQVKLPSVLKEMLSTLRATAPIPIGPSLSPEDTAKASAEALKRRKERDKKNAW